MDAIKFVQDQLAREMDYPEFRAGDNVVVSYKIIEGNKQRIQKYRGDVIQISGEGKNKTFTQRNHQYRVKWKNMTKIYHYFL